MVSRASILHDSPWRGVIHITGGGTMLLSEILTTPGASATVLEATVPYAEAALAELLGRRPDQACSAATARALAMVAFQRARQLVSREAPSTGGEREPAPLFGLGCTASLATARSKRGRHRAHVAIQTTDVTYDAEIHFAGDRETEERELLDMLWHALAHVLDLPLETSAPRHPMIAHTPAQAQWRELILSERLAMSTTDHDARLLLPGAFNPLHHGHVRMLEIAESHTGHAGAFELSIVNVDKPLLDYTEIDRRLRQFDTGRFHRPVWLTRLPTFIDKARCFPGCTFVIGIDTLVRIVEPRYYGNAAARDAALDALADLETRFLVFGRLVDDRFTTLADLSLPTRFRTLCTAIGREEFDEPISSTALRRAHRPTQER